MSVIGVKGPKGPNANELQKKAAKVQQRVDPYDVGFNKAKKAYGTEDVRAQRMNGPGAEVGGVSFNDLVKKAKGDDAALHEAARVFGQVAVAAHQDGRTSLTPAEREQAAAAFTGVGSSLKMSGESAITSDMMMFALAGVENDVKGFAMDVANKQTQKAGLMQVVTDLRKLANDPNANYPKTVTYTYTATEDGKMVTKTETLTVNNAKEATEAAESVEARMNSMGVLTQEMVLDLQTKQQEIQQVVQTFSGILKSEHDTLKALIQNLRA